MILRSASLAGGLSFAAAFVLAMPPSAQAGAHFGAHCNCGGAAAHSAAFARASVHTSVAVHASASAYSRAGGGYLVHTAYSPSYGGGYSHQDHYGMPHNSMPMNHYSRSYPTHYPARYPMQTGGHDYHRDYDHRDYDRRYDEHRGYDRRYGGNSYSLVYSPTYADSGYAGGYSGGYAAPSADYADYGGDYASPAPDYDYDNGYADTGYADNSYATTSYDDANYAPPAPEPEYAPVPSCACSQPVLDGTANAYGWRDRYGNWHVTSQSSRYSYSYSY